MIVQPIEVNISDLKLANRSGKATQFRDDDPLEADYDESADVYDEPPDVYDESADVYDEDPTTHIDEASFEETVELGQASSSKPRKYFSKEDRAKGKLKRNAEYRERLRIKKLLEEQGLEFISTSIEVTELGYSEVVVQCWDPSTREELSMYLPDLEDRVPRKRRRYFTEEERVAAKRRRDAEYRERQRLKKLMADQALLEEESGNPEPLQEEHVPSDQEEWNESSLHDESMEPTHSDDIWNNDGSVGYQDDSTGCQDFENGAKRKRRTYFTEEERIAGKRRRDAEYRERKRLRKLMMDSQLENGQEDNDDDESLTVIKPEQVELDMEYSHSSLHEVEETNPEDQLESDQGWTNQAYYQDESSEFHENGEESSKRKRRKYLTEEERIEGKRRRDAEYRERKKLKKLFENDLSYELQDTESNASHTNITKEDRYSICDQSSSRNLPGSEHSWNHSSLHEESMESFSPHQEVNSSMIESAADYELKPKRQKYNSEEERLAAKRRRDAEYRDRKRLRKLLEVESNLPEQNSEHDEESKSEIQLPQSSSTSSKYLPKSSRSSMSDENDANKKRRRYFSDEERMAAKRRRDAEYRERQKMKKLSDSHLGKPISQRDNIFDSKSEGLKGGRNKSRDRLRDSAKIVTKTEPKDAETKRERAEEYRFAK
jgi:hypothetical protein